MRVTALLHDIGKLKIPQEIINKPGKLDAREFEIIKTHTTLGAEILSGIQGGLGVMVRAVCLYHHEWHNGGGYWGLCAGELPAYIPIVSICDVYFALTNERPYKQAWSVQAALDYIQNQAGAQFSYELVEVFIPLIHDGGAAAILG
jgi:putative two-component system response regulator